MRGEKLPNAQPLLSGLLVSLPINELALRSLNSNR
jgi:hypothetical protein